MEWGDLGGGLIGAGLAGIGSNISNVLRQNQAQEAINALGQHIQAGDIDGAIQSSLKVDPSGGMMLKLIGMKQQQDASKQIGEGLASMYGGASGAPPLPATGAPSLPATTPGPQASVDPTAFAASIAPQALEASRRTGIDPRLIVAQAAVESEFGKHAPGNNLFGIKSTDGSGNNLATTEISSDGRPYQTTGNFMAYASPQDSVSGYADFINANPRYAALKAGGSLENQLAALGKSGYASDPNYASKVGFIAKGINPGIFHGTDAAQGIQLAMKGDGTPQPDTPDSNTPDAAHPDNIKQLPPPVAAAIAQTDPGSSRRIQTLIKMSLIPGISDGQRQTIQALLRNEQDMTKLPEDVKKYNIGRAQGYTGTLKDWLDKSADPVSKKEYDAVVADNKEQGLPPPPPYGQWMEQRSNERRQNPAIQDQQRVEQLQANNIDPASPEGKFFRLNGKLPDNFGQLPEADKKQLNAETDKQIALKESLDHLQEAARLNPKAYTGSVEPGAATWVYRNLPFGGGMDKDRVVATTGMENAMQLATSGVGKAMFGARVTNYDEQLLQKMRANPNMSVAEREDIINRLIKVRQEELNQSQKNADSIQSKTRYKAGATSTVPAGPVMRNGYKIEQVP
jgi:hypothetical protein